MKVKEVSRSPLPVWASAAKRGAVSKDLPLNLSRETLQLRRVLRGTRRNTAKKRYGSSRRPP